MDTENRVVIGVRGSAKQAIAAAIIIGILALAAAAPGIINLVLYLKGGEDVDVNLAFGVIFLVLFAGLLALSIYGFITPIKNNKLLRQGLDVLVYDTNNDVFICYDGFSGKRIEIKNGNIQAVSGSAFLTARELKVKYVDENGRVIKKVIGFARNIDGGALKSKLNEYHKGHIE